MCWGREIPRKPEDPPGLELFGKGSSRNQGISRMALLKYGDQRWRCWTVLLLSKKGETFFINVELKGSFKVEIQSTEYSGSDQGT